MPKPARFFLEDSLGRVWCNGNILLKDSTYQKTNLSHSFSNKSGYYVVSANEVLFMSDEGLIRMKDTVQTILIPKSRLPKITSNYGYLYEDKQKNIWICTIGDGVYLYPPPKEFPNEAPTIFLNNDENGKKVSSVLQDHEGNYWFGTLGGGLYMLPSNYETAFSWSDENGLSGDHVNAVLRDKKGNIWLGMDDATVDIISSEKYIDHLPIYIPSNDKSYKNVLQLRTDAYQRVWVLTPSSLTIVRPDNIGLFHQSLVLPANKSDYTYKNWAWLPNGTGSVVHSKGLMQILPKNKFQKGGQYILKEMDAPNVTTYTNFYDIFGNLWMSNLDGLHLYISNKWWALSSLNPLLSEKIRVIRQTNDGTLILAIEGQGLTLMKNSIKSLKTTNKYPFSDIKRILIKDSMVWCAGNHGLIQMTYKKGKMRDFRLYGIQSGLVSEEINDIFVDDTGIYVATSKGLTVLKRDATAVPINAPSTYITEVVHLRSDSTQALTPPMYTDSKLGISYGAIAFRDPETIEYQYRLSTRYNWTSTKNTSLTLTGLAAGNYEFEVRARHADSKWGRIAKYKFTITPYFWETWWFWLLGILAVSVGIMLSIRQRILREQKKENDRLEAENTKIKLEQQALQSMMNPHFIFNVMNSVQYFLNHNQKEAANHYLTQFARLLRTNLQQSNKEFISLEDEIKYLKLYLSLEKLRCGDKMTFSINEDEDLDIEEIVIPPMLLQPFVENAIWHGIMPTETGGHIQINMQEIANDLLRIEITDNGVGIKRSKALKADNPSAHHSLALSLTQERLRIMAELTKQPISIQIEQIDDSPEIERGGTRIFIILPMNWEKKSTKAQH
jgi:ligand-binding sensor domain-containing protein/two-component sensor histidine kinase